MACGVALMLGVRLPLFGAGFLNGLWLTLIGWFLNNTAIGSYQQLLIRQALEHVPVAQLMRPDVIAVLPVIDVQTLVDVYFMRSDQHAFPVTEGGRLLGLVTMQDLQKVPRDVWPSTTAAQIMTPASELAQVTPQEDTIDAMRALARQGVAQLPVVDHGVLRGLLRREDILKWLSLSGFGSPPRAA
jgi:CBS domain-containing protein